MAEVYTVSVNNESPVEITGGRVGNFIVYSSLNNLFIGDDSLAATYVYFPPPDDSVASGIEVTNGLTFPSLCSFYVTSPDNVFAVTNELHSGTYHETIVTIFHNR